MTPITISRARTESPTRDPIGSDTLEALLGAARREANRAGVAARLCRHGARVEFSAGAISATWPRANSMVDILVVLDRTGLPIRVSGAGTSTGRVWAALEGCR